MGRPKTIADLRACPWNPRRITGEAIQGLQASLKELGDISGLVFNTRTGHMVAGHQRLEALKRSQKVKLAGKNGELAVVTEGGDRFPVRLVDWDEATEKLANIAANSRHIAGEWTEGLGPILDELKADLPELYGGLRLAALKADVPEVIPEPTEGLTDPDAVPDEGEPVTKPGDLWVLGDHRVLCGDATKAADVERVTDGKCDACLTDPPYGCGEAYLSHDDTQENLASLAVLFFKLARDVAGVVALTPGIQNIRHYPAPDWMLCWFYGVGTGRTPWGFTCWQPCLVYGKDPYLAKGMGCHPDGVNKLMTHDDAAQNRALQHTCPKPMTVWAWFLERVSPTRGESIFDPFLGSGTTLIACEQLARKCYGIEIEPKYVDVIVRRWQDFTGKRATLEDGTEFPDA